MYSAEAITKLREARKAILKEDLTIDAYIGIITDLMGSVLHQLRDIVVVGNKATIRSYVLDKSGLATFENGSLVQSFQAMADLVYRKARERELEHIENFAANATTFEQLFDVAVAIEKIIGDSLSVRLWEDSQRAYVFISPVEKSGPAGTQIDLFRQALIEVIKTQIP